MDLEKFNRAKEIDIELNQLEKLMNCNDSRMTICKNNYSIGIKEQVIYEVPFGLIEKIEHLLLEYKRELKEEFKKI